MSNAVEVSEVPSKELCDLIANLTEEGLELVRRLIAFADDYRKASNDFDLEVEGLDQDDERYQAAAVRSGLPVLHATVEQMSEALCVVVGITDEELLNEFAA